MKKLKIDDFLQYHFLSNLSYSPDGKRACLAVSKADGEKNTYCSSLYLYEDGHFRKLINLKKGTLYNWEDSSNILIPFIKGKTDKKRTKDGEAFTSFYRYSIDKDELSFAFEIPFTVTDMQKTADDEWLILGEASAANPDYYLQSAKKRKQYDLSVRKESDTLVMTEIPFYFNGAGFTEKKRTSLFLCDRKNKLTRISEPLCDVRSAVSLTDCICFLGSKQHDGVNSYLDTCLYFYDRKTKELTAQDYPGLVLTNIALLNNKLIVTALKDIKYQILPEENFYTVDITEHKLTLFAENPDTLGNASVDDCRYGSTHSFQSAGNSIYFTKTVRNSCGLYRLSEDGCISELICRQGTVDDFCVSEQGNILICAMYDNKLEEIYSLSPSLKQLSSFNEKALNDRFVSEPVSLKVNSDGTEIDGWVLLPKNYDASKTYPAILDIHGGPRCIYSDIFFHEMQFFASEGYFVFFCNPTGGAGRGAAFADISGKYGQTDYKNIMDFTDAVLEKYPQIDKKRIGCTGGSYGGFMSNWILGHTDRFAAIATQRSISNWISFYGVSDIGFDFSKENVAADIYSEEGIKKLWDQSPLKYISSMKTPTLILHSDEDYRCPLEQGLQLFTALKEQHVPARLCCFKGENHDMSRSGKPRHRIRRLQEIINWMNTWCSRCQAL